MGRGSSGIGAGKGKTIKKGGGSSVPPATTPEAPQKRIYNKGQINELTASFTPEQFLGDTSKWTGTTADAKSLAEENMPKELEIGGYTFKSMGDPYATFVSDGKLKNNDVVIMDYQCSEKIGNEYPVIQVGVRIRKYRGKVQTEIIRDHPQYGTKFW